MRTGPRQVSFDDFSELVAQLLGKTEVEGKDGIYFFAAQTAATITEAKHAIVVLRASPTTLRVAACWGEPTVPLAPPFPITRGVIGKVFRGGWPALIPDVAREPDYFAFDADSNIRSELAVPILDPGRSEVEAVINVESHRPDHFGESDIDLLQKLGRLLLLFRQHLLQHKEVLGQYSLACQERDCWYQILEALPDEVLIIDTKFRLVHANTAKCKAFLRNNVSLPHLAAGNGQIVKLFGQPADTSPDIQETCHWLIELDRERCPLCVCQRAMRSRNVVEGVVYQPRVLNMIVELSAAPLVVNDNVLGCVETARNVSQRERITGLAPTLWGAVADSRLIDETAALQSIAALLHDQLGYARVRVYQINSETERIKGIVYAGPHRRLSPQEFSEFEYAIPTELRNALLLREKAGLLILNGDLPEEESFGYWRAPMPLSTVRTAIDPTGKLELDDVEEIAVVPLLVEDRRYALFIDSFPEKHRFTHDDLQALTTYARFANSALVGLRDARLRSYIALFGESTIGLVHELKRLIWYFSSAPAGTEHLHNLLVLLGNLLPFDGENGQHIASALEHMRDQLGSDDPEPPKGAFDADAHSLEQYLQAAAADIPERFLYALVNIPGHSDDRSRAWLDILRHPQGRAWLELLAVLEELVLAVKLRRRLTRQPRAYLALIRELKETWKAMPAELHPRVMDVNELIALAVEAVKPAAELANVMLIPPVALSPTAVTVTPPQLLFALLALLDNGVTAAAAYRGPKHPKVVVSASVESPRCVISVSNNGAYVRREDIPKLFKEIFTTKGGTGLGLLLAAHWVQANGGEITHEYEEGSGMTTFRISLPVSSGPLQSEVSIEQG